MNASVPNLPSFGIHWSDVTNERPSLRNAGQACFVVEYAMRTRIPSTTSPAPSARPRNARSSVRSPDLPFGSSDLSGSRGRSVRVEVMRYGYGRSAGRQLVELGDGLLRELGRQLGVAGVLREVLAVGEDEVQVPL